MAQSLCKRLAKSLGGKWEYRYPCYWVCDDGKRRVIRCSAGTDEFDNSLGTEWWLYSDGKPERAEKYMDDAKRRLLCLMP